MKQNQSKIDPRQELRQTQERRDIIRDLGELYDRRLENLRRQVEQNEKRNRE